MWQVLYIFVHLFFDMHEWEHLAHEVFLPWDGDRIGGKARLAVSLNLPMGPAGVVWYFLKLDPEKHITAANFKRCVWWVSLVSHCHIGCMMSPGLGGVTV